MYINKIKFERTGGFAGIRLKADVEMEELPDDLKYEIIDLLDEADFDDLAKKMTDETATMPDEFTYSIEVEARKGEYKISASESSLPGDLQPLIEILERIAKSQMRKK